MGDVVVSQIDSCAAFEHGPALSSCDLRHVLRLTDDTGIFPHAHYSVGDRHHGYNVDDNSRALLAALYDGEVHPNGKSKLPLHRYLAFVHCAFDETAGHFRNSMAFDHHWREDVACEDTQGHVFWILGVAIELAPDHNVRSAVHRLLKMAMPRIETIGAIRSRAFAIAGLQHLLQFEPDDRQAAILLERFATALLKQFKLNATTAWPWWEPVVAYASAALPQALLLAGRLLQRQEMIDTGLEVLDWLLQVQTADDGHLAVIGDQAWFTPHSHQGRPAPFDQQPREVCRLIRACLAAAAVTGESLWLYHAHRCFHWFLGANDLGQPMYDKSSGGCRDGLYPAAANRNKGAESTLSYLLSALELHRHAARPA